MGGQVQFMAESIPQAAAYHKQGKVRALAVTSRARNPALPEVPTVIESGLKGFEVVGFYGFLAPAGTPKDVVAKLSDAFGQVMQSPEVKSRMVSQGADPAFLGADDFAKFLAAEMPRWADAVKKSGAKLDWSPGALCAFPREGGCHRWPGRAGSTVALAQGRVGWKMRPMAWRAKTDPRGR